MEGMSFNSIYDGAVYFEIRFLSLSLPLHFAYIMSLLRQIKSEKNMKLKEVTTRMSPVPKINQRKEYLKRRLKMRKKPN